MKRGLEDLPEITMIDDAKVLERVNVINQQYEREVGRLREGVVWRDVNRQTHVYGARYKVQEHEGTKVQISQGGQVQRYNTE